MTGRSPSRPAGRLLGVALAVCLLAGGACGGSRSRVEQDGPAGAVPQGPALARYYAQPLTWTGCSNFAATPDARAEYGKKQFRCSYLTVPLDYANPAGRTIRIGLLRRAADAPDQRIGSLIINPGGPGASGMEAVTAITDAAVESGLTRRFDLVGVDPRGVGASQPRIECLTGPERDADRLDLDVDTSSIGVAQTEREERDVIAKCVQRTGLDVLAHVGTADVAADLDVLRSALGDAGLTFLGYSYGTHLGATYAARFPRNVRAMVLDGAVDPSQSQADALIDQLTGFQQAFEAFAAWCAGEGGCPLGDRPAEAVRAYRDLVSPLIEHPLQLPDDRQLSYNDAQVGTVQALYSKEFWPVLHQALAELANGRGRIMMLLADAYLERAADGRYANTQDANAAILCVDKQRITDRDLARDIDRRGRVAAPFLDDGSPPSDALGGCAFWPVPVTETPVPVQLRGLAPTLVISTTGDPATPYEAGQRLARTLGGRMLTVEGHQHTAYLGGVSPCADQLATRYLIDLRLPADGTRCPSVD